MAEPLTDNPAAAAQIRQLLAERENAVAYGQDERIKAVDKQLEGLGYKGHKQAAKAAAEADEEPSPSAAQSEPPKGRTATSPKRTTAEGKG